MRLFSLKLLVASLCRTVSLKRPYSNLIKPCSQKNEQATKFHKPVYRLRLGELPAYRETIEIERIKVREWVVSLGSKTGHVSLLSLTNKEERSLGLGISVWAAKLSENHASLWNSSFLVFFPFSLPSQVSDLLYGLKTLLALRVFLLPSLSLCISPNKTLVLLILSLGHF